MATKSFTARGLLFVTNNYAAPLNNENLLEAFHLIQNFLADSEIGRALVEPMTLSAAQIGTFWQLSTYDDGGETGTPSIIFSTEEKEFVVTPDTVRDCLGFDIFTTYSTVGDDTLKVML